MVDAPAAKHRVARATHGSLVRAVAAARAHSLFLAIAAIGAALRIAVSLAYDPALFVKDSWTYLANARELAPGVARPVGYPAFLDALPTELGLRVIPLAQHLLGLAIAVVLYVLLLRLGVRRSLAALATAPVLLDPYQLVVQHYILADTLFELLLVAGCALLLWRRPLPLVPAGVAGLVFAAAALTRVIGVLVIGPALVAAFFLADRASLRARLAPASALFVA
jgi:hypothetical protein